MVRTRLWAIWCWVSGVSDRFASGFLFLDKLGLAARFGYKVVARQALIGGSYRMIDPSTMRPKPDYWTALLHRQLVGNAVLDVDNSTDSGRSVRLYAHCARQNGTGFPPGSVVLLVVNLLSANVTLHLQGTLEQRTTPRIEYLLSPPGFNISSQSIVLNQASAPLQVNHDGSVPWLVPLGRAVNETGKALIIPGHSYGFVVLLEAAAPACQ